MKKNLSENLKVTSTVPLNMSTSPKGSPKIYIQLTYTRLNNKRRATKKI